MLIGVIGDVHANHAWLRHALTHLHKREIATVIQVGDLGVTADPREAIQWNLINKFLRLRDMTMYVAPGNHDDYDAIERLPVVPGGWLKYRERILLAPRGHRSEHGGRIFVWLGGAGSLDRTLRLKLERPDRPRSLWWPQEVITDADVQLTVAGGHADIMVCHDAPYPVGSIERRLTRTFDPLDVIDAHASRERLTRAVAGVGPDLLLHGHHHFGVDDTWTSYATGHTTRVFGLGKDWDTTHGVATLDTALLTVRHVPVVSV